MKLLDFAEEEIAVKKCVLEIMEESGEKHEQTMKTFSESISGMTNVISSCFFMLQGFIQQPLQLPFQKPTCAHQHKGMEARNTTRKEEKDNIRHI